MAERRPNLTFDVAVWNLLDIRALLARVAPEQILYGTDAPYYGHACSQAKLLLALREAGGERRGGDPVGQRRADRRRTVAARGARLPPAPPRADFG